MSNKALFWLGIALACVLGACILTSILNNVTDTTPTWTYVTNARGAVVYETASQGYPKRLDATTQTFLAANPNGTFSEVRTNFVVTTFAFRVQVFMTQGDGFTYFGRSYSGDANFSAPEPTPEPALTSSTAP